MTSLLPPHLSSSLTDFLPSLNHSKTDTRFIQEALKAVWSIPYASVVFFPSLKQKFIAYRSSKVADCIFEIHQMWQSGFSRVYSNCSCSYWFELEIIKVGQSSHKMDSNKILNFQVSTKILNTHTKRFWKLIVCTSYILGIYIYIYIYILNSWNLDCDPWVSWSFLQNKIHQAVKKMKWIEYRIFFLLTGFFRFSIHFIFLTTWWLLFCKTLHETPRSQSQFHDCNIYT